MFVYHPPKGMCWGHVIRPKTTDWQVAKLRLYNFLQIYFDLVEEKHTGSSTWRWKSSTLPHVEWPEDYLIPENRKFQDVHIGFLGDRISFVLGLRFPLSIQNQSSYEFISRFSADAPFKMSPKHFTVITPTGKHGKYANRKPEGEIAKRLNNAVLHEKRAA